MLTCPGNCRQGTVPSAALYSDSTPLKRLDPYTYTWEVMAPPVSLNEGRQSVKLPMRPVEVLKLCTLPRRKRVPTPMRTAYSAATTGGGRDESERQRHAVGGQAAVTGGGPPCPTR